MMMKILFLILIIGLIMSVFAFDYFCLIPSFLIKLMINSFGIINMEKSFVCWSYFQIPSIVIMCMFLVAATRNYIHDKLYRR